MAKKVDENQLDLLDIVGTTDLLPPQPGTVGINRVLPPSGSYIIYGKPPRKKKPREYLHIYAGTDNDPLGRTKEAERSYAEKMFNANKLLYPNVHFTLVFVDHNKVETDITEYIE